MSEVNTVSSSGKVKCRKKPGLIKRLFFWWLCPIFYWGNKRGLDESDLVNTKKIYTSRKLGDLLERNWKLETIEAPFKGRVPSLLRVLIVTFKWRILLPFIPTIVLHIVRVYFPIVFGYLLLYWSPNTKITLEDATLNAAMLVLLTGLLGYSLQHGMMLQSQLGMSIRIAVTSLMYRKILRMSLKSLRETPVGQIINLMSNDASRFDETFLFFHHTLLLPIQLPVVVFLMYRSVGVAAIIGIAIIAAVNTPLQVALARILRRMRAISALETDSRIRVMDEIISGIRVIKMYAWEEPFSKVVANTRNTEIEAIRKASWARVGVLAFQMITEQLSLFVCILSYTLLGNQMTATVLYPMQQFFTIFQAGLGVFLPNSLSAVSETLVSIGRIQDFLNTEERPDLALSLQEKFETFNHRRSQITLGHDNNGNYLIAISERSAVSHDFKSFVNWATLSELVLCYFAFGFSGYATTELLHKPEYNIVELKNIEARWNDDGPLVLDDFSLTLQSQKLCAVVGSVGSGKSSLLQLLLKELPYTKGSLVVNGGISYAAQDPWLFPQTVRENILFGLKYDHEKYKEVCKACSLQTDFLQLEFGDHTLVGERGVSLSGGQKARINLARAIYRDADIYLLDDPLSAVDTKVGRKLYRDCISGYLRNKSVILVTHQMHYLKTADIIVLLDKRRVSAVGKYDDLRRTSKEFAALLPVEENKKDGKYVSMANAKPKPELVKSDSDFSVYSLDCYSFDAEDFIVQKIEPETRAQGVLKLSVLVTYCTSGGLGIAALALILIGLAQILASSSDYWLSYWMNQVAKWEQAIGPGVTPTLDTKISKMKSWHYLVVLATLVTLCLITVIFRTFSFVELCMRSSAALHNKMFSTLLTAVMRFFDTSTTGRILNRFSKDIGAVDELLPKNMIDTLQQYMIAFGAVILNAIALPITLISSTVLLFINLVMTKLYLNASQSLKRLEGTTKSPVFGLVASSINGIATIRSSYAQRNLIKSFDETQDMHTNAWNTYLGCSTAYGHYLDVVFLVYMSFLFIAFLYIDFGDAVQIGDVGIAVSKTLALSVLLQFGARQAAQTMAQLTAVERVLEYTQLETEKNLTDGKIETPSDWPTVGKISFKNVSLSYSPEAPLVLKDLTFKIPPGAKVGVVGRTGAGKSSLISALFRFTEIEGHIIIDDIDTKLIAKQELRSRISIIPQEPVLFSASIRYNLDPFDKATDDQIWKALELVELKDSIPALDFVVSEGGANFSVGQRQLVCLARAVLTNNKILVMDEATANVDPLTDGLIQKTIRSFFTSCTVLTIAHRLNTIMDSDLVLVMDVGKVAEFDHPYILLSNGNSKLSSMARETGPAAAEQLFDTSRNAYFSKNIKSIRL